MTDWELWACANQMSVKHGDDAALHAALRADALLEADDWQGCAVWLVIAGYIEKLRDMDGPVSTRH